MPSSAPRPAAGPLPALAVLLSPRLGPVKEDPSALTVTIRIPSRNGGRVQGSAPSTNDPSPSPPRGCPKRKRTEVTQKQESSQLRHEVQHLEEQLTKLQRKASMRDVTGAEPTTPGSELEQTRRDVHLYVATLGSVLFQNIPSGMAAPVHSYIHLGSMMEDRRRTILKHKPEQLRLGRELVEQRSKFLDITHPQTSDEWYTTDAGDVCGLHFHVEQLRDFRCVDRAFDAAIAYVSSYEVTTKKTVSVMTYHDDSLEPAHNSNMQLRIVMQTADGPTVEANTLLFTKYDPSEKTGIIVANYVDKDDLRPYDPTKRVRQDVAAVVLLSLSPVGVVLRHWLFVRTKFAPHLLDGVSFGPFARENEGHSAECLAAYIRNQVLAPQTPGASTPTHP